MILLAAEFLKQAKPYVEEGVSTQQIIKAYNHACAEAVKKLNEMAVRIENQAELRGMLIKCAATALSSKLVGSF